MARLENQNGSLESNTIHWSFSKADFFFFFLFGLHQEDYWNFYLNKLWEFQTLDLKSETWNSRFLQTNLSYCKSFKNEPRIWLIFRINEASLTVSI